MRLEGSLTLLLGALAILGFGAYVAVRHPSPGELSAPHASLGKDPGLAGCEACHVQQGRDAGCSGCHVEISSQLTAGKGFHGKLLGPEADRCSTCHSEHWGKRFPLVSSASWGGRGPEGFTHSQAEYVLRGKHEALECKACHVLRLKKPFSLPSSPGIPRETTYLGLSQECLACHEDVHAGGLSPACESCHTQEAWKPAPGLDHDRFLPLVGGHAGVACSRCHPVPVQGGASGAIPAFQQTRGKTCEGCHSSPHRAPWGEKCAPCHEARDATWLEARGRLGPAEHARAGFPLVAPHAGVSCAACHRPEAPYNDRFPDPGLPGSARRPETCERCHADPHRGQFRETTCVACHRGESWLPVHFGQREHRESFPLLGAHAAVPCAACHPPGKKEETRIFVGTKRDCKVCHANPHGDQFNTELSPGDCSSCHVADASTFLIRPFDHAARTRWPLLGAHARASCGQCHARSAPPAAREGASREAPGGLLPSAPVPEPPRAGLTPARPPGVAEAAQVYRGLSTECSGCHRDPHLGQLRTGNETRCDRCHKSSEVWTTLNFDHGRDTKFALDAAHEKVPCVKCHARETSPAGTIFVRYKPLGTRCEDCHAAPR